MPQKVNIMYFGKDNLNCENLLCMSNDNSIEFVEQCVHVHLGRKNTLISLKKN